MPVAIEPTRKTIGPPQWCEWPQDSSYIDSARRAINEHPLKGSLGRLDNKHAMLFGAGAVGGVTGELLARSGVGKLTIVDPDTYGDESFLTQPSWFEHRGSSKAWIQGARLQRVNPACRVRAARCEAQEVLFRDLLAADIFVVAGDNLQLAIWAGRTAAALGKPLVQGAVHGETASAIARGYDLRDPTNTCPKCNVSLQELSQQTSRRGCDIGTQAADDQATRTQPTICATAGAIAANEAIKFLAGHDDLVLRGAEQVVSTLTYQAWKTELPRNEACDLHQAWNIHQFVCKTATIRDLADELGIENLTNLQVRGEIPWNSFTFCERCSERCEVRRFARLGSEVGECGCGATLTTCPQGVRSVVPQEDLMQCLNERLDSLGLVHGEAIGIQHEESWNYFV